MLGEKIVVFDGGNKWFIPSFIEFQYPKGLNPGNNVHDSVLQILNKYNLIEHPPQAPPKPLPRGAKDKDKEQGLRIKKEATGDEGMGEKPVGRKALKSAEETEKQKLLKTDYDTLQAEMTGKDDREVFKTIREFVQAKHPSFAEPYVDAWNIFAPTNNIPPG